MLDNIGLIDYLEKQILGEEIYLTDPNNVKELKKKIREHIWNLLEENNIARFPRPVYGRIPNFVGAEEAAYNLFKASVWRKARVVKVNPDSPQQPIRLQALRQGKILIMPTPRIRSGFILLDPQDIPQRMIRKASTIRGAFLLGKIFDREDVLKLPRIDLIVIGSVAVDKYGTRIGKGGGYAELEYAVLRELGKADDNTPVVTTIHDIQLLDEKLPREKHDLPVDIIITPSRIIRALQPYPKPRGIYWELLEEEKIKSIPILQWLYNRKIL